MNKVFTVFVIFVLFPVMVKAQDRYAVFYKYKPQELFSLDRPEEFLTDRALLRRAKEGIAIDSMDLPVTQRYIGEVMQLANSILYQSKWFNASLIVTDTESIKSIKELSFVDRIELVGRGYLKNPQERMGKSDFTNYSSSKLISPKPSSGRTLTVQELPSDFQNNMLGIDLMHEEGIKGKGIFIAVFDAGFPGTDSASPLSHLLSNDQLVAQKDFVRPWNQNVFTDNQHGTNVLSLIAADETETFIAGAPESQYFLAITEEVATEYRIEEYNWLRAAEFADSIGIDIINSSLGYYDFDDPEMNYSSEQLDGKTAIITQAANIASSKGILVVNSVGNYGPSGPSLVAPADSPNVLAIGSVNQNLEVSSFSSRGPTIDGRIKPDLSAFGNGVALLRSNGGLGYASGTSFSAPQITALAAGLWQAKPEWTRAELIENLIRSASQYENPDNRLGYGIPNFRKALYGEILSVQENEEFIPWKVFPNPQQGSKLTIYFGSNLSAQFALIDINGKTMYHKSLFRSTVNEPYELELEGLPSGMYLIRMQDKNLIKQQKLIRF